MVKQPRLDEDRQVMMAYQGDFGNDGTLGLSPPNVNRVSQEILRHNDPRLAQHGEYPNID